MSVDRTISLRIVTNREQFSDLFIDFAADLMEHDPTFEMTSVAKEDNYLMDIVEYSNFETLKEVLDYRQSKNYYTSVTIYSESIREAIYIGAKKLEQTYEGYTSHFEITISPGIGKRIKDAERYTDFGFYLNVIIPALLDLGCYVCEVNCQDFDS